MGGGASRPYVSNEQIYQDLRTINDAWIGYMKGWDQYWVDRVILQSDINDYNLDAYTMKTNISLATLYDWIPKLVTSIIDYNNIFGSHIQNLDGNMTSSKNVNSLPYVLNATTPLINKTYEYTWLYVYCSNQVKGREVQQYVNNLNKSLEYTKSFGID